jgi:DNA-binding NtrC family response regulator
MSLNSSPGTIDRVALVVDDEADLRDVLSELLVDLGWTVHTAESCEQGLEVLEEHVREISVVVADYLMPEKTGIDFLREIRARGLLTPVVFFSANGVPKALVEAIRLGAADFCDKSNDFSTILNAVEKAHMRWELVLKNARALAEVSSEDLASPNGMADLGVDLGSVARKHLNADKK